jgi:5-methylcytosine-specific restriction endonuclease McrA
MNQDLLKQLPLRLEESEYRQLRGRVLRRDAWRCQFCGSMTNLEVHHQQFRSHSGPDDQNNLITLCNSCHWAVHTRSRRRCPKPNC